MKTTDGEIEKGRFRLIQTFLFENLKPVILFYRSFSIPPGPSYVGGEEKKNYSA